MRLLALAVVVVGVVEALLPLPALAAGDPALRFGVVTPLRDLTGSFPVVLDRGGTPVNGLLELTATPNGRCAGALVLDGRNVDLAGAIKQAASGKITLDLISAPVVAKKKKPAFRVHGTGSADTITANITDSTGEPSLAGKLTIDITGAPRVAFDFAIDTLPVNKQQIRSAATAHIWGRTHAMTARVKLKPKAAITLAGAGWKWRATGKTVGGTVTVKWDCSVFGGAAKAKDLVIGDVLALGPQSLGGSTTADGVTTFAAVGATPRIRIVEAEGQRPVPAPRTYLSVNGDAGVLLTVAQGYEATLSSVTNLRVPQQIELVPAAVTSPSDGMHDVVAVDAAALDPLLDGLTPYAANVPDCNVLLGVLSEQFTAEYSAGTRFRTFVILPTTGGTSYAITLSSHALRLAFDVKDTLDRFGCSPSTGFDVYVIEGDVPSTRVALVVAKDQVNPLAIDGPCIVRGTVTTLGIASAAKIAITPVDHADVARRTEADASGVYEIRGLVPGRYRILASANLDVASVVEVDVDAEQDVVADVDLDTLPDVLFSIDRYDIPLPTGQALYSVASNRGRRDGLAVSLDESVAVPGFLTVTTPTGALPPGGAQALDVSSSATDYSLDVIGVAGASAALPHNKSLSVQTAQVGSLLSGNVAVIQSEAAAGYETFALGNLMYNPMGLCSDAYYVYWGEITSSTAPAMRIRRCPRTGGQAQVIGEIASPAGKTDPISVTVGPGGVYVTDGGRGPGTASVWRLPKAGGAAFRIGSGMTNPNAALADADFVFWASIGPNFQSTEIWRANATATDTSSAIMLASFPRPSDGNAGVGFHGLALSRDYVYFGSDGGGVHRVQKSGPGPIEVAVADVPFTSPGWLLLDSGYVCWSDSFGSAFSGVRKALAEPEGATATQTPTVSDVARNSSSHDSARLFGKDDRYLYFFGSTESGGFGYEGIYRAPIEGGPAENLYIASTSLYDGMIAGDYIYWTTNLVYADLHDGAVGYAPPRVMRMKKPAPSGTPGPNQRPAGAPDYVVMAISGHNPDASGGGADPNHPNFSYLTAPGDAAGVVRAELEAKGRSAVVWDYVDAVTSRDGDDNGTKEQQGFVKLVADLRFVRDHWIKNGAETFTNATKVILLGHSHGVVWSHAACKTVPDVPVALQIDLDGVCEGVPLTFGDWELEHVGAFTQFGASNPMELSSWGWNITSVCDVFNVTGFVGSFDVEDVVFSNVTTDLDVQSAYDFDDNYRLSGASTGILRKNDSHNVFTGHRQVHQKGSVWMDWVAQQLQALNL